MINAPGVAVVDVDEPEGADELVKIRSASICASDFRYIAWGTTMIRGHELAGVAEDGTRRDRDHVRLRWL